MRTSKFKATREPTNQQQQQPASIKAKKTKMKRKRKGKLENPSYISLSHIYLCTQYIHHSIHTLLLIYATYCFSLMCPLVLHIYTCMHAPIFAHLNTEQTYVHSSLHSSLCLTLFTRRRGCGLWPTREAISLHTTFFSFTRRLAPPMNHRKGPK